MDSIKPSGYIQCWRDRNGQSELVYSNKNSINPLFFTYMWSYMFTRESQLFNWTGRVPSSDFQIDGMAVGSYGTDTSNTRWSTWCGTFAFGSNSNFAVSAIGTSPLATCYGTFNFSSSQTINFMQLGCGTIITVEGVYFNSQEVLAYKFLSGTDILSFISGDILRINWSIGAT